jgi:DNA-directed RNA polymerase subunit RPC12/RpoP
MKELAIRETVALPCLSFLFRNKKKPETKIITCSECGKKSDRSRWEESIPSWEENKGYVCPRCGYVETNIE